MVEKAQWAATVSNGKIGTYVITLPKLTPTGTNGSITFINGVMSSFVAPT